MPIFLSIRLNYNPTMNTLYKLIESKCRHYGDRVFLQLEHDGKVNYLKFFNELEKCNIFLSLQSNLKGGNYSIIAPNCVNYLLYLFCLQERGGAAVNLNSELSPNELKVRLNIGKVSLLLTTASIYPKLAPFLAETGVQQVLLIDERAYGFSPPEMAKGPFGTIRYQDEGNQRAVAFLQFTGGTTGITKAAVISHRNIIGNIEQLNKHFGTYIDIDSLFVPIAFPFYHIFSIVFNVLFFLSNGGTCILYSDLRNIDLTIKLLKKHSINFTVGVNTWYRKLMQHPDFGDLDFSLTRVSLAGGEYVPVSTKQMWISMTGKPLYSAYGLTETSSLVIVSPLDESNLEDSIGILIPETKAVLLDDDGNELQSENVVGELALKGPQVSNRYYEDPFETAAAFHNDWFKTGDIAERIGGRIYRIIDRKKDMISVSGNKVYPNEVEAVISELEDVLDVSVMAIKSGNSGEEVAACIVVKPRALLTDEAIIKHCRMYLVTYKVPRHVFRYLQLPKTPIGKTDRKTLKSEINNGNI